MITKLLTTKRGIFAVNIMAGPTCGLSVFEYRKDRFAQVYRSTPKSAISRDIKSNRRKGYTSHLITESPNTRLGFSLWQLSNNGKQQCKVAVSTYKLNI